MYFKHYQIKVSYFWFNRGNDFIIQNNDFIINNNVYFADFKQVVTLELDRDKNKKLFLGLETASPSLKHLAKTIYSDKF